MPVEGLKSVVQIPPVTRRREVPLDPRGEKRRPKKEQDRKEDGKKRERKVDITV